MQTTAKSNSHILAASPRFADLDTQRHVTSRTYEDFCREARFAILAESSYTTERLLEEKIHLVPRRSFVRFFREQMPGARLQVHSVFYRTEPERILWVQEVREAESNALACRLLTETETRANGNAIPLKLDGYDPGAPASEDLDLLAEPPQFGGSCRRVSAPAVMLFSDRTIFYDYPPTALWRLGEEGRWSFGHAIGLDQKKILETDTITFFTAATFAFHRIPGPGEELAIHSWIEKIEKIRCFMRQDVTPKDSDEVLLSIREEQLIVSLSRRRPRKAPPEFIQMVSDYMETA
ncbi:MAG: hypothetical protein H7A21_12085 [Spirochaetales bacterium]|nr:hypothetical protein [Leptospiraceae bacterium]MCP5482166.1 hypothetical protein [Spirochaetales bacterium]MCP5484722.1 hypothetical protein [Spirochaetales bacterium]